MTEKIINDTNSDIVIITETHFSNANVPKMSNFRSFNRNRISHAKGGVCIFVREEIARDAIQVFCGEAENEVIAMSLPCP